MNNSQLQFNFSGQTVIVTGGTRGIGRGIAEAFLKAGAQVIVTYLKNDQTAMQFKEDNHQYRGQIDLQKFDIADFDQVKKFFHYVEEKYPQVHVVVNNSGLKRDNLLPSMTGQEWNDVINTNLNGTFYMCQMSSLLFLKNRYGRIINISSIGGKLGLPGQTNYAASKAGQIALTQSLSKELAKKGITVNAVAPGFISTELLSDMPAEKIKEYEKTVPMKRFGKVEEVAAAVLFLASAEASYITGSTLEITGGL